MSIESKGEEQRGIIGRIWDRLQEVEELSILGSLCQIECSNNARLPAPRWYVIGTKGTFMVHGKQEPIWGQVEMYYEDQAGEEFYERIELIDVCESGIEGGFYRDLVPYLNGEKETFVSMYEASRVVKILELIKKSSEESRFIPFDE